MARDLSGLGLNDRLQAVDSPITRQETIENPYLVQAPDVSNPPGLNTNYAGTAIVDGRGVVSNYNFASGNATFSGDQGFTTTNYTDITGLSLTLVLQRSTRVALLMTVQSASEQTNGTLDMSGRTHYGIDINGTTQLPEVIIDSSYDVSDLDGDNMKRCTYTTTMLKTLASGTNTIKGQYKISGATNMTSHLYDADLTYIRLGA